MVIKKYYHCKKQSIEYYMVGTNNEGLSMYSNDNNSLYLYEYILHLSEIQTTHVCRFGRATIQITKVSCCSTKKLAPGTLTETKKRSFG